MQQIVARGAACRQFVGVVEQAVDNAPVQALIDAVVGRAAAANGIAATVAEGGDARAIQQRNESMPCSRAQTRVVSIISRAIMRCSVAVFSQQVECSTAPAASSRW